MGRLRLTQNDLTISKHVYGCTINTEVANHMKEYIHCPFLYIFLYMDFFLHRFGSTQMVTTYKKECADTWRRGNMIPLKSWV